MVMDEIAMTVPLEGVPVSMELAIMVVLSKLTSMVTGRMVEKIFGSCGNSEPGGHSGDGCDSE